MVLILVAFLTALGIAPAAADTPQHRPAYHFSPAKNWMNDPNGLVFHKGVYHLFFQYNPLGDRWGNMSWGHATSTDLVHWDEQPVAIPFDANEGVFSGSVVVDTANSSGFGTAQNPPLVAMYTSAYTPASGRDGIQAQSLAYSTDDGQTWTKYSGNPVIDIGSREFRDPKVFWYAPANEWRMVAVVANEHKVLIWRSTDLKQWTRLSEFGPRNAIGGVWECPDLFPLAVDGDPANVKWVMLVSLNPGGIAGGSGTQYFVGDFDGTTFTADGPATYEPPAGTLLQGFENGYAGWTPAGTAFGSQPAAGALPGQQTVTGYVGERLVNSFIDFDAAQGELTSPSFTIDQRHLNFLIGGGRHPAVPGATQGDPGGEVFTDFETLDPATNLPSGWSATGDFVGYGATSSGLPYHQGDKVLDTCVVPDKCDLAVGTFVSPEFTVTRDWVNLLIAGGTHPLGTSGPTVVELVSGGRVVGSVTGNSSGDMDWRHIDASSVRGETARIVVRDENSTGDWGHLMVDDIRFSDTAAGPRDTQTTVNLVVDGDVVRSSTGTDSEALDWASWDLADLQGRSAQIRIVDHSSGGWGHILADQFMLASAPAKNGTDRADWVDYGRDNYAGVTFNGLPDEQRISIGWMNNWQYAQDVPTSPWRGQMTMPRTLSLVSSATGPQLRQTPVAGVDRALVNRDKEQAKVRPVATGERATGLDATVARVEVRVALGSAAEAGVVLRRSADGSVGTRVGVRRDGTLVVDRTRSGDVGFNALFPSVEEAPVTVRDGEVTFTAYLDRSSVEVLAQGGQRSVTDLIYPPASATGVATYAVGGTAKAVDVKVTPLRP
ncbi:glycosyl hydrolase family 32 [Knoellia aerolata DSM 18566]|uniref:Glycosyl hydrolase family 32 n=1 Tax=Knoellia aerolata DSM 18566 TaxID=1385519 RepID=A0A0A0JRR6_9MICO|nr:glycosyl hydrolase family 32 [Knoellia aerolata DSM 18566]